MNFSKYLKTAFFLDHFGRFLLVFEEITKCILGLWKWNKQTNKKMAKVTKGSQNKNSCLKINQIWKTNQQDNYLKIYCEKWSPRGVFSTMCRIFDKAFFKKSYRPKQLIIFSNSFILDVWHGPTYDFEFIIKSYSNDVSWHCVMILLTCSIEMFAKQFQNKTVIFS